MTQELNDFKEFVKLKVQPLKQKVSNIEHEISHFKEPILAELIKIRQQNEALLRELGRQKGVYKEMLSEFYKMVALTENKEMEYYNNIYNIKDNGPDERSKIESPILKNRNSGVIRHWKNTEQESEATDRNESPEFKLELRNKLRDSLSNQELDMDLLRKNELKSKSIPRHVLMPRNISITDNDNKLCMAFLTIVYSAQKDPHQTVNLKTISNSNSNTRRLMTSLYGEFYL
jgi:hypothetical protein